MATRHHLLLVLALVVCTAHADVLFERYGGRSGATTSATFFASKRGTSTALSTAAWLDASASGVIAAADDSNNLVNFANTRVVRARCVLTPTAVCGDGVDVELRLDAGLDGLTAGTEARLFVGGISVLEARDSSADVRLSSTAWPSSGRVAAELIMARREHTSFDDTSARRNGALFNIAARCVGESSFTSLARFDDANVTLVGGDSELDAAALGEPALFDVSFSSFTMRAVDGVTVRRVATAERVAPTAEVADARFVPAATAAAPNGGRAAAQLPGGAWSYCDDSVETQLLVAGARHRFGAECMRVGADGTAGMDTATGAACTPDDTSTTCIWRLVSTQNPDFEHTMDTANAAVLSTSGGGDFAVLSGASTRAPEHAAHGHCIALPLGESDWSVPASIDVDALNGATFGATALMAAEQLLDANDVQPTLRARESFEWVEFSAGTPARTFYCPTLPQAQVLVHRTPVSSECRATTSRCLCKSTGDPHQTSFDGRRIDYMGFGERTLHAVAGEYSISTFQDPMRVGSHISFNRVLSVSYCTPAGSVAPTPAPTDAPATTDEPTAAPVDTGCFTAAQCSDLTTVLSTAVVDTSSAVAVVGGTVRSVHNVRVGALSGLGLGEVERVVFEFAPTEGAQVELCDGSFVDNVADPLRTTLTGVAMTLTGNAESFCFRADPNTPAPTVHVLGAASTACDGVWAEPTFQQSCLDNGDYTSLLPALPRRDVEAATAMNSTATTTTTNNNNNAKRQTGSCRNVLTVQVDRAEHDFMLAFFDGEQFAGNGGKVSGGHVLANGATGKAQMPTSADAPFVSNDGGAVFTALDGSEMPLGRLATSNGWMLTLPAYDVQVAFKFNTWRANPHLDVFVHTNSTRMHATPSSDITGICGDCNCDASNDPSGIAGIPDTPDSDSDGITSDESDVPLVDPNSATAIPSDQVCPMCLRYNADAFGDAANNEPSTTHGSCTGTAVTITAIVHDVPECHPDFQAFIGSQKNMVAQELTPWKPGSDLMYPTLRLDASGDIVTSKVRSQESFQSWWNYVGPDWDLSTTHGVSAAQSDCAQAIDFEVEISGVQTAENICCFDNAGFFPIDGRGYGNEGRSHNYWFSMEVRSRFTYQGTEEFEFCGDDDVWVFINKRLFVDLGGVHGKQCSGVKKLSQFAETLSLELGGEYSFDIFFAERRTSGSNFVLQTSCFLEQAEAPACERLSEDAIALCCSHLAVGSAAEARCIIETAASCECNTQQMCEDALMELLSAGTPANDDEATTCRDGIVERVTTYAGAEFALLAVDESSLRRRDVVSCTDAVRVPEGWQLAADSQTVRAMHASAYTDVTCLGVSTRVAGIVGDHTLSFDVQGNVCEETNAVRTTSTSLVDACDNPDEATQPCLATRRCATRVLLTRKLDDTLDDVVAASPLCAAPAAWSTTGSAVSTERLSVDESPLGEEIDVYSLGAESAFSLETTLAPPAGSVRGRFTLLFWYKFAAARTAQSTRDHDVYIDVTHRRGADVRQSWRYVFSSPDTFWRHAVVDVPYDAALGVSTAADEFDVSVADARGNNEAWQMSLWCDVDEARMALPSIELTVDDQTRAVARNHVKNPQFSLLDADRFTVVTTSASSQATADDLVPLTVSADSLSRLAVWAEDGSGHAPLLVAANEIRGIQQTVVFENETIADEAPCALVIQVDTRTSFFYGATDLTDVEIEAAASVYFDVEFTDSATYPTLFSIERPLDVLTTAFWRRTSFVWSSPYGAGATIRSITLTVLGRATAASVRTRAPLSITVDNLWVSPLPCGSGSSAFDLSSSNFPVSQGSAEGDPHTRTLDGFDYDFHLPGDYVLMDDSELTVYARHEMAFNARGSINTAAQLSFRPTALYARGTRIEVYTGTSPSSTDAVPDDAQPPVELYVDGVRSALASASLADGVQLSVRGSLADAGGVLRIVASRGSHAVVVKVSKSASNVQLLDIVPKLPATSRGGVRGLLGNFNDDPTDDLRLLETDAPIATVCSNAERDAALADMDEQGIARSEVRMIANCPSHPASVYRPSQRALFDSGFAASMNVTAEPGVLAARAPASPLTYAALPSFDELDAADTAFTASEYRAASDACARESFDTFAAFVACVRDRVLSGGELSSSDIGAERVGSVGRPLAYAPAEYSIGKLAETSEPTPTPSSSGDSSSSDTTWIIIVVVIVAIVVLIALLLVFYVAYWRKRRV